MSKLAADVGFYGFARGEPTATALPLKAKEAKPDVSTINRANLEYVRKFFQRGIGKIGDRERNLTVQKPSTHGVGRVMPDELRFAGLGDRHVVGDLSLLVELQPRGVHGLHLVLPAGLHFAVQVVLLPLADMVPSGGRG